MIESLAINLVSAFVGFLIANVYVSFRKIVLRRTFRWFWVPYLSDKVILFHGKWPEALSDLGELEPVVNLQDALTLGELRLFLKSYYSEVVVATDRSEIDWHYPVISLGGPIPNKLAKDIGERKLLPIWFLDMPYLKQSTRTLGSAGRAEEFKSQLDETGQMISDVGLVARIRSPENNQQVLYIIAGNYGTGTLGVIRFLTSAKCLDQLRRQCKSLWFESIIRSRVSGNTIVATELIHYRDLG